MSEVTRDFADIVYYPVNKMSESVGIPQPDCLNIITMVLWVSLCFAFSQITGPIKRRVFSSFCGLSIGFFYFGVSYWVNLVLIGLVILFATINLPSRRYNAYLTTTTAVLFIIVRAVYE